jgi:hypothetical protein
MLSNLSVTVTARESCEAPPEIVPPEAKKLDAVPASLGEAPGCTSTGALAAPIAALLALTLLMRRRRE